MWLSMQGWDHRFESHPWPSYMLISVYHHHSMLWPEQTNLTALKILFIQCKAKNCTQLKPSACNHNWNHLFCLILQLIVDTIWLAALSRMYIASVHCCWDRTLSFFMQMTSFTFPPVNASQAAQRIAAANCSWQEREQSVSVCICTWQLGLLVFSSRRHVFLKASRGCMQCSGSIQSNTNSVMKEFL
jgi:hypothetical protein